MASNYRPMAFPFAGEMDKRITIRLRKDSPAANMGLTSEFEDVKRRWASLVPVGTATYTNSVQTGTNITHRVVMYYLAGITTHHEIVHGGKVYRVVRGADIQGTGRFLVLEVEELGNE